MYKKSSLSWSSDSNRAAGGNQQFTVRNAQFFGVTVAIDMLWDWGWTWKSLTIVDSTFGIRVTGVDVGGSLYILDSLFQNVGSALLVSTPSTGNQQQQTYITIDNMVLQNTPNAIIDFNSNSFLAGGTTTIESWTLGRFYDAANPDGAFTTGETLPKIHPKTQSMMGGPNGGYFERSKPQYEGLTPDQMLNAHITAKGTILSSGKTSNHSINSYS